MTYSVYRAVFSKRTPQRPMNNVPKNAGILTQLPAELHYLIAPVLSCGCLSNEETLTYLNEASAEQFKHLAVIARCVLVHDHYPEVGKFLERYPVSQHPESAKLYYFFAALDQAGLEFDELPNWGSSADRR
jgi:hypothetical protein